MFAAIAAAGVLAVAAVHIAYQAVRHTALAEASVPAARTGELVVVDRGSASAPAETGRTAAVRKGSYWP